MTRRLLTVVAAAAVLGLAGLGLWRAAAPAPPATQAARVDAVAQTLRCPTCQGLSVADSPSKVADGMRDTIREQLAAGRSPDEVRAWFVDRYGPWILLSPSPAGLGWLVWLLPVVAVAGGAAVAFALLRRPPGQRSQAPDDLEAARQAVAAYGAGALSIPDSPAGERLESALALVEAVRADQASGVDTDGSERLALERVAAALTDRDHEQRFEDAAARPAVTDRQQHPADSRAASEDRPAAAAGTGRRPRVTGLRWAAVAGGFFLVLAGLLSASVSPRAAGDPPTGSLPQAGGQAADEDLGRLEDLVARDPTDTRSRLRLAAALTAAGRLQEAAGQYRAVLAADPDDRPTRVRLAAALLQTGQVQDAETQARAVLDAEPGNLDALLLLGFAQALQRDPAGQETLRRFLAVAPSDHPGRPAAEGLVKPDGQP